MLPQALPLVGGIPDLVQGQDQLTVGRNPTDDADPADPHDDADDFDDYPNIVRRRRSTEVERLALWSPVDVDLPRADRTRTTPTRLNYSHEVPTPRRTTRHCRDCDARLSNIMRSLNFS